MNIAVLSDSHDNIKNIKEALNIIQSLSITHCVHLGDYTTPETIAVILEPKDLFWKSVFGNCDLEPSILSQFSEHKQFDIVKEPYRSATFDGHKIFLTHYPDIATHASVSGKYKAVFYGHTHVNHTEVLPNGTLLANPGEIAGNKTRQPSFGIWDTSLNSFEIIKL